MKQRFETQNHFHFKTVLCTSFVEIKVLCNIFLNIKGYIYIKYFTMWAMFKVYGLTIAKIEIVDTLHFPGIKLYVG